MWHKELWLIDHGAALYFHHAWDNWEAQSGSPFALIKDHVLLPLASEIDTVNDEFKSILNDDNINSIVSAIPDEWLGSDAVHKRSVYAGYLAARLESSDIFVEEVQRARQTLI
jgi:hypothetical protein